ncbi:hypothetical protein [Hyphomonas sp.]|uniref:hypothetical protein n=1 Tax=Hyphomonas sp. TaxID=87 RepID=UPI00391CB9FA
MLIELLLSVADRCVGWILQRRVFKVVGEEFLDRSKWSYQDLLRRLVGLDHAMLPGANLVNEGTVEQWAPIFKYDPESWRLVVYNHRVIVGYFHAFSITDEAYASILSGEMPDSKFTIAALRKLSDPGVHKLYVCSIIGQADHDTSQHRVQDLVISAFAKHLIWLGKQGTHISHVCTVATTESGERLCRKSGLNPVGNHSDLIGGTVFSGQILPLETKLHRNPLARRLSKVYG